MHVLSPEIMNEFSLPEQIFIMHDNNVFQTHIPTSNRYELNLIPYKASQFWYSLSEKVSTMNSISPSRTLYENEIKLWECFNCPCNICKSYFPN